MPSDPLPAGHPSPHRERIRATILLVALFAGPLAWSVHLMVNTALAGYACYPHRIPRAAPLAGWGWVWPVLITVDFVTAVICAASAFAAWRFWRKVRSEGPGGHHGVLDAGEGRTRYLAWAGLLVGLGFLGATVFDAFGLALVPLCSP